MSFNTNSIIFSSDHSETQTSVPISTKVCLISVLSTSSIRGRYPPWRMPSGQLQPSLFSRSKSKAFQVLDLTHWTIVTRMTWKVCVAISIVTIAVSSFPLLTQVFCYFCSWRSEFPNAKWSCICSTESAKRGWIDQVRISINQEKIAYEIYPPMLTIRLNASIRSPFTRGTCVSTKKSNGEMMIDGDKSSANARSYPPRLSNISDTYDCNSESSCSSGNEVASLSSESLSSQPKVSLTTRDSKEKQN